MYLSRSAKPLKPYKPGAKGIVKPAAAPKQAPTPAQPKDTKIRVPGKNIPKRKPRVTAGYQSFDEEEYDVNAVKQYRDRQGAAEPEVPVAAPIKPVKSGKIGLPKQAGTSTKIAPKSAASAKAPANTAPEPTPEQKMIIKKKKDEQLLNKLITSVEAPETDTETDEDLVQQAIDGDYSDRSETVVEPDDDDLMSE